MDRKIWKGILIKLRNKISLRLIFVCVLLILTATGLCVYYLKQPVKYETTVFVLDTIIQVKAYGANAEKAVNESIVEMQRLQKLWDRYDDTTVIARINNNAGVEKVTIDKETYDLLVKANTIHQLSRGHFDVTIGPLIDLWSVGRENKLPNNYDINVAKALVDEDAMQLTDQTVFLPKEGMSLDVGGIGKVYALDKTIDILRANSVDSAIVDAGGDVRVIGRKPDGSYWKVGLQAPDKPEKMAAIITMNIWDTAETSGDYQRFFESNGVRYSHIIDPYTGVQPRYYRSVTILSNKAVDKVVSSVLFMLPLEEGKELVNQLDIGVIWIKNDGSIIVSDNALNSVQVNR